MVMRCAFCMVMDKTSKKAGVCEHCLPHTSLQKDGTRTMSPEVWESLQTTFQERSQIQIKKLAESGLLDALIKDRVKKN